MSDNLQEAEAIARTINLYWAKQGRVANARAVPIQQTLHGRVYTSYEIQSDLRFVATPRRKARR